MKNNIKRIEWIDLSKFIAIFFMVWCHTEVSYNVDTIVHSFHMPVFFILSGWCLNVEKHKKFLPFVISRAKSLIIPYFFWGVGLYLVWDIFYYLFNRSKFVSIKDFLYCILYNNAQYSTFAAVQWFLTCLFFSLIISWLVIKLCRGKTIFITASMLFLFVLGWQIPFIIPFRLPLALDVAVSASGFVLFGWIISNKLIPSISESYKKILLNPLVLLVEVFVGLYIAVFNGYVNMRLITYANPLLFYISAIILSLAIAHFSFIFCNKIRTDNILYRNILFLGKNTLSILMLNQFLIQPIKLVLPHFSFYNTLNINIRYLFWFGFSIILLIVMIPLIKFLNKYIPFSVGNTRSRR